MNVNIEYCDPFDGAAENFWMKLEHCGRYLWASDWLSQAGCTFVADIACANGYGSRILAQKIDRVVGIDRNEAYISKARAAVEPRQIQWLCHDLNRGPLPTAMVGLDAIVCFETLEHLETPAAVLGAFHDALRPQGFLLLSVPNDRFERFDEAGQNKDPFHLHTFSQNEMATLLMASGFSVLKLLGQDLCNRPVSRISELDKTGVLSSAQAEMLWPHDKHSVTLLASILGYPDTQNPEESYSHLYLCQRD